MSKYIVIHESYSNETKVADFIQAIGAYDDLRSAYGAAYLQLSDFAREDEIDYISTPYRLEGDTGFGMYLKHEMYTDVCFILFAGEDGFGESKEET